MFNGLTARYIKISSGYMGQLLEWPEVVTEGVDIEECRKSLEDAAHEMVLAYQQLVRALRWKYWTRHYLFI